MKKKKEEILPEQGCGDKVAVEKETTNEVVGNETVQEEADEEQPETEEENSSDEDGGCVEFHAPGDEFLEFLSKLLRMMKSIIELEKRLQDFEKNPTFNMMMDVCMAHLRELEASDKDQEPSDEDNGDDHKESCDDNEDHFDEDEDIVTEAFISMKVKKLKS